MKTYEIALVGCGGHSKVVQEIIELNGWKIRGYFDDRFMSDQMQDGIFTGPLSSVKRLLAEKPEIRLIIAIGHNQTRSRIVQDLEIPQSSYITAVHPSAILSRSCRIGSGSVIMAGAVIQADAVIGAHCIINTGSIIEHDTVIGDFAHISPLSVLTGSVTAGNGVHIGAGASVIPEVEIGEWAVIGAGSAVTRDIAPYTMAAGVPAEVRKSQRR